MKKMSMEEMSCNLFTDRPTPGPWIWTNDGLENDRRESVLWAYIIGEYGNDLAVGATSANAALIAAAPDMLKALKLWVEMMDCSHPPTCETSKKCSKMIRAAIAKAEGGITP